MTAVLLCCYSKPPERAAVCFVLLLSLFAYTTHTLYIAVSSVHAITCTHSDLTYTW